LSWSVEEILVFKDSGLERVLLEADCVKTLIVAPVMPLEGFPTRGVISNETTADKFQKDTT
jgi:hypothetical protein